MSREQFLKRLEELLYDISPEERREALEYYEGYFEDAGVENEAAIMQELESPQKVAQTIRAGISGDGASGLYTERGYQESQEQVNAPMVRLQKENTKQQNGPDKSGAYQTNWNQTGQQFQQNQALNHTATEQDNTKKVLIIALLVITSPFWLSLLGGVFGVLAGIFAVAVAVVIIAAVFIISGGALFGTSFATFAAGAVAEGLALAGTACLLWAVALVGIVAVVWFFGRLLPWFIRVCVDAIQSLFFHKKEGYV